MNCPNCQALNPEGARFCMSCGSALSRACPNCGTGLPANARFCFNCGHNLESNAGTQAAPIQAAGAANKPEVSESPLQQFIPKELLARLESAQASMTLEGERRVVTMLFCDVKGSTAAASQLDPEEWAEIINLAFEPMIRPIYHFEGTVARLMGDGLLAFFGAPIAHEDDPQRAVLAGLEILTEIQNFHQEAARRWGIDFNVRVGINTGLVVVGAVGSDLRMEYTALGDAINLAARMEQTAQPGTVQVSEATYKLIAPLFDFEALEPLEIKGKSEPVTAYRVLGQKARPGRLRGIQGLDAPLIGRQQEMDALQARFAELRQGRGQIVSIMGEAGLGKSRLLAELRRGVSADNAARLRWLEGRSLSYQTATPYAPFTDLLGDTFGLQKEQADASQKYERIKEGIGRLWPGHEAEIAPFIATLMDISPVGDDIEKIKYLEPPHLRSLVFAHCAAFFQHLASQQPLVLVFEDLHWIDPTSLDLLESLLPLTDRAALMIIAAFRPRKQDSSWRFHETAARDFTHCYTPVSLNPLKEAESRELLGSLLHIEDLPDKVRRLILERAEGNPFFVEELIRSLLDAGLIIHENNHWRAVREIENISLPNTLAGVITARLDRLDETTRRIVQAASVVGRNFDLEALTDLLGKSQKLESGLNELERRELIREKSRLPTRNYLFKHILTQEAAYASILLSRRRELHLQIARSMQQRQSEKFAEIARHFLEARQPAQAAPYFIQAGKDAARAYSTQEAIGSYSQVLKMGEAAPSPEILRQAYEGLGSALTFANRIPEAIQNYKEMLRVAKSRSDIPMQVSGLNKLAGVYALRMGDFSQAESYLLEANRLAREQDIKPGIVEMSLIRCQMCAAEADFEGLNKYMGEVIEIGRRTGSEQYLVSGLEHVAGSMMFLTRFDEAWEMGQEGLEIARRIGDRENEAMLLIQAFSVPLIARGELDEGQRMAQEGVQIATKISSLPPQVYGNWILCEIARWRGEYEQALLYGQRSLEAALPMESFMPFMMVQPLGALGSVYLDITHHFSDQVARFHQQALKILENPFAQAGGGTAWADLGYCAMNLGDLELAGDLFQKGLNTPTIFMYVERPRYLAGSALLALLRGQPEQALKLAGEGRDFAKKHKMRHTYPLIALVRGQICAALGESQDALREFEQAERLAGEMNMLPILWQARAFAAGALQAAGRPAEAQVKRQEARAVIESIGDKFQDEQLRQSFLSGALQKVG